MPKLFQCKTPCANCPYRKDAPVEHWHRDEFQKVLDSEDSIIGSVFQCHKQNGGVCVGWLMNQVERDIPSIALRISLSRHDVTREYLDSLHCKAELYALVEEMIAANFPEML